MLSTTINTVITTYVARARKSQRPGELVAVIESALDLSVVAADLYRKFINRLLVLAFQTRVHRSYRWRQVKKVFLNVRSSSSHLTICSSHKRYEKRYEGVRRIPPLRVFQQAGILCSFHSPSKDFITTGTHARCHA